MTKLNCHPGCKICKSEPSIPVTKTPKKNLSDMQLLPHQVPKNIWGWVFYPIQMVLAVFVATVLIANICGTPVDAALFGAGAATIIYECFTGFKSPVFVSSCGATCSAVIGALAMSTSHGYFYVFVGGLVIAVVYLIFSLIVAIGGSKAFTKMFPPIVVGPVTMVIGLTLAGFLPTYIGSGMWPMIVALTTMFITAICSHYFKGFFKSIAFLIGLCVGYGLSYALTYYGICDLVHIGNFDAVFSIPDFSFLHWFNDGNIIASISADVVKDIVILFVPVSICAVLEHYSDHRTLSNIIGIDLTEHNQPGLSRTLMGDGIASAVGTALCGLPNTSYGESIAVIGFSKVASVVVSTIAALILIVMSFISPVRVIIQSIPSCVFGGCAMILYGYIAASGLKTLIAAKPDLNDSKNLIIISVILTVGVSGIFFLTESFTGVALAMVLGVILNLVLVRKKR